jgi:hypothetical protein
MNTRRHQRHRYGDWRDMTVEEVRDKLLLQASSWRRYVRPVDQHDDHESVPVHVA